MNQIIGNIEYLNYLVRTYAGAVKLITQTKQRLGSLPGNDLPDEDNEDLLTGDKHSDGLETVKGRCAREIEKELKMWDIWELWMKHVPGLGPAIAGGLITRYYYRFIPICKKCGGDLERREVSKDKTAMVCTVCNKAAKSDGVLQYRSERRDFATISKWWAFMGRHTVDGVVPKLKKGEPSNWSTPGRALGYQIGEQFNRQKPTHPYKAFLLARKAKHEKNHPEWSKGHVHNAAKNEAVKLFLSHFWVVARELEGLPISEPYAGTIMGHTNIIQPFYWAEMPEKIAAVVGM